MKCLSPGKAGSITKLIAASALAWFTLLASSEAAAEQPAIPVQGTFSSWRPYSNPSRLVSVGMNKGEVLAIAGKPDHEESYYQLSGRTLLRISDWYYIRTGLNPETTSLRFVQDELVSIESIPTR